MQLTRTFRWSIGLKIKSNLTRHFRAIVRKSLDVGSFRRLATVLVTRQANGKWELLADGTNERWVRLCRSVSLGQCCLVTKQTSRCYRLATSKKSNKKKGGTTLTTMVQDISYTCCTQLKVRICLGFSYCHYDDYRLLSLILPTFLVFFVYICPGRKSKLFVSVITERQVNIRIYLMAIHIVKRKFSKFINVSWNIYATFYLK